MLRSGSLAAGATTHVVVAGTFNNVCWTDLMYTIFGHETKHPQPQNKAEAGNQINDLTGEKK